MLRSRFPSRAIIVIAAILIAALFAAIAPRVFASPPLQAQKITIGVIGAADSPTFEAVTLAVQRFAPDGTLTIPGNLKLPIEVIGQAVNTPEDVGNAVLRFKQAGAVAVFGPDADGLTAQSLNALAASALPIFTGATSTAIK